MLIVIIVNPWSDQTVPESGYDASFVPYNCIFCPLLCHVIFFLIAGHNRVAEGSAEHKPLAEMARWPREAPSGPGIKPSPSASLPVPLDCTVPTCFPASPPPCRWTDGERGLHIPSPAQPGSHEDQSQPQLPHSS